MKGKKILILLITVCALIALFSAAALADIDSGDGQDSVVNEEATVTNDTDADVILPAGKTAKSSPMTWSGLQTALNAGGTVVLTNDVTAGANDSALVVRNGTTVNLDLNGYTIDRNLANSAPVADGSVIKVEAGGTLNIQGPTKNTATSGTITGGNTTGNGGGILNKGTVRIVGKWEGSSYTTTISISGNQANGPGGAIYNDGGTINSNTTTFSDNYSASAGGAIYIESGSVAVDNYIVNGNQAAGDGSDFYLNRGSLSVMPGCFGSSIYVNGGIFKIYPNCADCNVYLAENAVITTEFGDDLYGISVSKAGGAGVITSGFASVLEDGIYCGVDPNFYYSGDMWSRYIGSLDPNYIFGVNAAGEGILNVPIAVSFAVNGGDGEMRTANIACDGRYMLPKCGFTPPPGKYFVAWSVQMGDAAAVTCAPGDTIIVTAETTVTPMWASGEYTLSATAEVGNVTTNAGSPLHYGDSVTVTAQACPGYRFDGWYDDSGTLRCETLSYTFTITEDTVLTARYTFDGLSTATVTINSVNGASYTVGGSRTVKFGGTEILPLGTLLTIYATDASRVLYWTNASDKIMGTGSSLSFTVTGDTTVTLVYQYSTATQSFVRFLSDYNQVIAYNQYAKTDNIIFPVGPAKYGHSFDYWSLNQTTAATEADVQAAIGAQPMITLRPHYTQDSGEYTLTINYISGTSSIRTATKVNDLAIGTGYKATAPAINHYDFSHWEDAAGNTLGYDSDYLLLVSGDMTLNAVYVPAGTPVARTPIITIGELYQSEAGMVHKVSGQATRSVPEGYTLIEHGMLYARDVVGLTTSNFTYGNAAVDKYVSSDPSPSGVLTLNVSVDTDDVTVSLRGYMLVRNDSTGNSDYYYTEIREGSYNTI